MNLDTVLACIDACNDCYDGADIVAGPDGRDGASISTLPTGETVLAFRGTLVGHNLVSVIDWINDFHAELLKCDAFPGRVHAGFMGSLNDLWLPMLEALEGPEVTTEFVPDPEPSLWERVREWLAGPQILQTAPEPPPLPWERKLIITGHSKGGGIAQMAAVRLRHLRPTVVTFGAPMVGDIAFASEYPLAIDGGGVTLTRYEGYSDIVPHLPPLGYRAVGRAVAEVELPANLKLPYRDRLVSDWPWETIQEAHSLDSYRNWIKKLDAPPALMAKAA